jgi:hypothetical protein
MVLACSTRHVMHDPTSLLNDPRPTLLVNLIYMY